MPTAACCRAAVRPGQGEGGAAVTIPLMGDGVWAGLIGQNYHRSSPLKAIKAQAPQANVTFRDGRYITDAVEKAKQSKSR
jgi:beta-glucosidase